MTKKMNRAVSGAADDYPRRQMISRSIIGLGSLAIARAQAQASAKAIIMASSRRFQAIVRPKSIARSAAPSRFSPATSWAETSSWCLTAASSRLGVPLRGQRACIRSPGLNCGRRVRGPESSWTTPASRRTWPSPWRAGGTKTIGRRCGNI